VTYMGQRRFSQRFLTENPLRRPRYRWETIIKMELKKINLKVVDWINLAQKNDSWPALVNPVMNFRFPQNVGNLLTS
jgi:late competence protein required for DNA uptake (superfamily II DNA/RNA helicase)